MKRLNLLILFFVISFSLASGANKFGIGFDYSYGIPITDLRLASFEYYSYEVSDWYVFNINDGDNIPVRSSPNNFSISLLYKLDPRITFEGGLEVNTGYRNDSAILLGEVTEPPIGRDDPIIVPIIVTINENYHNWRMYNYYIGGRYNFELSELIQPYVNAGVAWSRSLVFYFEDEHQTKYSDQGNHFTTYFGGAINIKIMERFYLTFPIKLNFVVATTTYHQYHGNDLLGLYDAQYKPPSVVTFGAGFEAYPKLSDIFR